MLNIVYHSQFKKDYKRVLRRGCDPQLLASIITMLANREALPAANRDHALTGNYKGMRECHIQPDWLLIYQIREEALILVLARTGSHSDLF
ncbi:type II toxin-antitoxin system YafQ family toxin [uncultured Mailhella sp.]|uniref:type II toxin-antitoxin system RelE/ParE family toxin n=1 Tax=uncultured Mailhella sp. TaxID=1981031 RepID=UPI003207E2C2